MELQVDFVGIQRLVLVDHQLQHLDDFLELYLADFVELYFVDFLELCLADLHQKRCFGEPLFG